MDIIKIINEELQDINNMYSYLPQGYEHKILDETYKSISEIRKLANDILLAVAANNYPIINKDQSFKYLYGLNLNQIDATPYSEIRKYVEESNLQIYFSPKEEGDVHKGSYSQIRIDKGEKYNPKQERDIELVYDYNELKDRIDTMINEKNTEGLTFSVSDIYQKIYYPFISTLIHELQHSYDDYRSGGHAYNTKEFNEFRKKYMTTVGNITKNQLVDLEAVKSYLNLPHEIWARFSQAIEKLHFYSVDFNDTPGEQFVIYEMKPMNEVIKKFGYTFENYRLLPDDMKKRLIRKVAQFWHYEEEKVKKLNQEEINKAKQQQANTIVKEEINNMFEGINVFHGSDRKFDNFDMEKIGSGDGKSLGGWGIYFSDSEDVSNRYVTSSGFLGQYEIRNGSYFDLDDVIDDGDRIIRGLQRLGVGESQIEEFQSDFLDYGDVTNRQAYEWLTYVLGGEKQASQFLESLGYLGNTFIDKWNTDARNYVIFNTKSINKIQ